ncbi:MAG: ATP-binding cassette domain-containing protein [Clostridia bacterium]|nr:ATP-binding cassette domain-containing protein [Clostridia bacterium]
MIEVKNLVKRYGDFTAVRDVSFTVRDGVICGFLGPNGAGKSTTMNIIAGTLAATEGEVVVNGYDIYEDPIGAKSSIGYLPEQPPLYPDMTAGEYLAFVGEARGLSGDKLWEAVDRAVERTGLGEYADRMIRNLSKGYRQRVGIAQAILTDPEIIILDEPTVGLDPRQIIEIRSLIRELGRDHTVILSSHILGEIAEVCDEVIIIAHGEIAAADTLENLVNRYEGKNIVDLTVRGDAETVRRIADSVPGVTDAEIEAKSAGIVRARLSADRGTDVRETVFFRFADARIPILSMSYEETTLEKVFLELTKDRPESPADTVDTADPAVPEILGTPEPTEVPAEPEKPSESAEPAEETEPAEPAKPDKPEKPAKPAKPGKKQSDDDYTPLFGG